MAKKLKDTDYLYISTRLRCLENQMLSRAGMEQMLKSPGPNEAARVLTDLGYQGLSPLNHSTLSASLSLRREEAFREAGEYCPNPHLVDVFRVKYDYHNAKALIKSISSGASPDGMFIDAGRYTRSQLQGALEDPERASVSPDMLDAMLHADEVLHTTLDPQRCDFILDKACYGEMLHLAEDSRSVFLADYVKLQIDALNLRSAVRGIRMEKGMDFLRAVLIPGGTVEQERLISAALSGSDLMALFPEELQEAAFLADQVKKGGRQTEFEKACDNALTSYLKQCHRIPFGDSVVAAYLAAVENEIISARIIMSGKLSGVDTVAIRERLRDVYV